VAQFCLRRRVLFFSVLQRTTETKANSEGLDDLALEWFAGERLQVLILLSRQKYFCLFLETCPSIVASWFDYPVSSTAVGVF
jgi:hypothetical protein